MNFFTIYIIGSIITFILARSQMQGRETFLPALLAGAIWPLALLLKLLIWSERK
ncbi:hypothetical protein [Rodentibacter caecimuris]|uniref:hypothetical protein n=1 Tax=Rodentibacter caecimuris TaxID=1796644 RepID=UPI0015C2FD34